MLLGIYIPYKIATHGCKTENLSNFLQQHVKLIGISATALGIVLRVIVTTVSNYFRSAVNISIRLCTILRWCFTILPLIVLFNATVALYTIPIALAVTIAIVSKFKLQ